MALSETDGKPPRAKAPTASKVWFTRCASGKSKKLKPFHFRSLAPSREGPSEVGSKGNCCRGPLCAPEASRYLTAPSV